MKYLVYILFTVIAIAFSVLETVIKNKKVKTMLFLGLLTLYFLLGVLKGVSVGTDTRNYLSIYNGAKGKSIGAFLSDKEIEYGFYSLVYVFSASLNMSEFVFTTVIFLLISILLFFSFYRKKYKTMYLSLFLFVGFFCMSFSGIRQSLSIALATFGFSYYFDPKNKNLLKKVSVFYLFIVFAILCHKSAVLLLLFPVFAAISLKFYQPPIVLLLFLLFFPLLLGRIFILLIYVTHSNELVFDSRVSITMALQTIFIIVLYFVYDTSIGARIREKTHIKRINFSEVDSGYMWIVIFSCLLMSFNTASNIASRFSMYFYLGIVYFMCRVVDTFENKKTRIFYVAAICLIMGVYFVYSTPTLGLTPYVFR